MDLLEIGEVVRGARKRAQMTQERLAECVGCNRRTVIRLETGAGEDVRMQTLLNMLTVLDLDLDIVPRGGRPRPDFVMGTDPEDDPDPMDGPRP